MYLRTIYIYIYIYKYIYTFINIYIYIYMKTIFDDKGKDIYILYMFLSCDFFENG